MTTRTSILAVAIASASISALLSTSASAWEGPMQNHSNAYLAQQIWQQQHGVQPVYTPATNVAPTYVPPTYAPSTYAPSTTVSCGCQAPATQTYVAPTTIERHTLVIEKKVFVPVPVEKKIYIQVPVVEQRPAVAPCNCEAPANQAYVAPPVVETQPTEAPCACEAPAQQTYVQPPLTQQQVQMQMPVRPIETLAPMDRRPAAFASRELQK